MKTLVCADCETSKAVFLFPPNQRDRGTARCIQCLSERRKKYKVLGSQGPNVWRDSMRRHFAK